jgi:putative ABC transport system permease protein
LLAHCVDGGNMAKGRGDRWLLLINESTANLIAFDPPADFSVVPWLGKHLPGVLRSNAIIAGGRTKAAAGEVLRVCGKPLVVYGRLQPTGVGPFDQSYFLSFDALAALKLSNVAPGASNIPKPKSLPGITDGFATPPATDAVDLAKACEAGPPLDRVSAFLLQLFPGARMEDIKFAIAQLPNVRIVEGNATVTASRQALDSLFIGASVFAVLELTALMIVVSLVFSAIVQERFRELGVLRAMGAWPSQIMVIVIAEASIVTGFGGLAGLALGSALLLIFARSLGFYFDLLNVPFPWPPFPALAAIAATTLGFSAVLGLAGAFLPAWRTRSLDPFSLIYPQER